MNRITELFKRKQEGILNVFCTAGYPNLNDLVPIIKELEDAGADIVEIGMPFSDPMADGSTIQASNKIALDNGMTLKVMFEQLKDIRKSVSIPLLLMGYINPALQFGFDAFLSKCREVGIDGLILPDLPMMEYETEYRSKFKEANLSNVFLITPQTSEERIQKIDELSNGFIYVVSTYATTGGSLAFSDEQIAYFEKIKNMKLNNPTLIGFGIRDKNTFQAANQYANGAIIGSAFINALKESNDIRVSTREFVNQILN